MTVSVDLVELWEIKPPLVVATINAAGTVESRLIGQTRESVRAVFRKDQSQVPGVLETMIWNRGAERSAFARFTDSDDLYALSWPEPGGGMGTASVLLAAAQVPGLSASDYDGAFGGRHAVNGYVYSLEVEGSLDLHPAFVWLDTDLDGSIDSTGLWGYDDFVSQGLKDIGQWLEYAGQDPPL